MHNVLKADDVLTDGRPADELSGRQTFSGSI